jgi:ATP-dependent DNA helicase RecG
MDIEKLIKLSESETLEFKRDTSSLGPILKTIVAFSNTAGGVLIIGIDDNGAIIGLDNPAKTQEQLISSIADNLHPQVLPNFKIKKVNGLFILAIQIEYVPEPYYIKNKGIISGTYIRIGNSTRLAGPEVISEMQRANYHTFFDKIPCNTTTIEDLDESSISKVFAQKDIEMDISKLIGLNILTKKGRKTVATNGGVILFGKKDVRLNHFPFAEVKCARFAGTSRAEFIDQADIQGTILNAIEEVPKFIRRNTRMAGKFGQMRRKDIPEYPTEGIREALVNALVHANYEVSGTRVFVSIYDDRLEIQNPGIMPPGMNIEQFKAGVSRVRNPVIARVFKEMGLIEEWGSGYKRIKSACLNGGYPEPKWQELGVALRVTFYPHHEVADKNIPLSAKSGTQSAPSRHPVKINNFLQNEEYIKLIKYCKMTRQFNEIISYMEWKDRTKFRRKFINPLLENGILRMTIPDQPNSSKQKYIITEFGVKLIDKE